MTASLLMFLYRQSAETKNSVYITLRPGMDFDEKEVRRKVHLFNERLRLYPGNSRLIVRRGNFDKDGEFDARRHGIGVFTIFFANGKVPLSKAKDVSEDFFSYQPSKKKVREIEISP